MVFIMVKNTFNFDFVTDPPKLEDGFRFLTIVFNKFTNQYEYRICDYCQTKKRWREVGNLDELSSVFEVIGWLKLPPSKDIIEKIKGC